jgi:hypothetical protein
VTYFFQEFDGHIFLRGTLSVAPARSHGGKSAGAARHAAEIPWELRSSGKTGFQAVQLLAQLEMKSSKGANHREAAPASEGTK